MLVGVVAVGFALPLPVVAPFVVPVILLPPDLVDADPLADPGEFADPVIVADADAAELEAETEACEELVCCLPEAEVAVPAMFSSAFLRCRRFM